jgi:pilus assembly protein FimV
MGDIKKLASACLSSLVFALLPAVVRAVTLGDIHLQSHLNEPLAADISLKALNQTQLSDIIPEVADPETYASAGLEVPPWLNTVKFEKSIDPITGNPVIHLRTHQPIKDPFVDLMIQITWPGGKLVREYTLLLDPPKEAVSSSPTAPTRAIKKYFQKSAAGGKQYGPTQNETLWKIAKDYVTNTPYSVYQGIAAIAQSNPDAFTNDDINRLRDGVVLNLPDTSELAQYSSSEAQYFVRSHKPLSYLGTEVAQAAPQEPAERIENSDNKRLQLVSSSPDQPAAVKKNSSHTGSRSDNAIAPAPVLQRLSLVEEAVDTLKRSNEEITHKNLSLQEQNESLAAMLAKKEEEIKQLKTDPANVAHDNGHFAVAKSDMHTPAATSVAPTKAPAALPKETKTAKETHKAPVTTTYVEEPLPERRSDSMKRGILLIIFSFILICSGAGWMWFSRDRLDEIFRDLRHNLLNKLKGRIAKLDNDPDAATVNIANLPADKAEHYGLNFDLNKALDAVVTEETRHLKPQIKFTPTATDVANSDQSKGPALEEIDLYIAYERYAQAEKMLKNILTQNPYEWEAVLKLLELYVLTENYSEFEKYSSTIPKELSQAVPEIWAKVQSLQDKVANEKTSVDPNAFSHTAQPPKKSGPAELTLADQLVTEQTAPPAKGIPLLEEIEDAPLPIPAVTETTQVPPTKNISTSSLTLETVPETTVPPKSEPIATQKAVTPTVANITPATQEPSIAQVQAYIDKGNFEEARNVLLKILTESPSQTEVVMKFLEKLNKK